MWNPDAKYRINAADCKCKRESLNISIFKSDLNECKRSKKSQTIGATINQACKQRPDQMLGGDTSNLPNTSSTCFLVRVMFLDASFDYCDEETMQNVDSFAALSRSRSSILVTKFQAEWWVSSDLKCHAKRASWGDSTFPLLYVLGSGENRNPMSWVCKIQGVPTFWMNAVLSLWTVSR